MSQGGAKAPPRARPLLLRPDNFTPATRTPWGGDQIVRCYKRELLAELEQPAPEVVGESWEISVEPSFPSTVEEDGRPLQAWFDDDPVGWLGTAPDGTMRGSTPLLVKLLDAADDLSVQVHPESGDPTLRPDESGKPEAWIILHALPDAGIYLGFRDGVTRREVRARIGKGGALRELLQFVPVSSGDVFALRAGTPHAIGGGITLLEPQLVEPGRRAVTYRFWDWGRRYDDRGRRDPNGSPRPLHVERSLAATRWERACGAQVVDACRQQPRVLRDGDVTVARLVDWEHFVVDEWSGEGPGQLDTGGTLVALSCLSGRVTVSGEGGVIELECGRSAVLPAAGGPYSVELCEGARLFFVRAVVDLERGDIPL